MLARAASGETARLRSRETQVKLWDSPDSNLSRYANLPPKLVLGMLCGQPTDQPTISSITFTMRLPSSIAVVVDGLLPPASVPDLVEQRSKQFLRWFVS